MEFNARLQEARKDKNMSQTKLAEIMATKQQTISKWETGILEPCYRDLKQLCNIFEVSADYLLGLTDY